MIFDRSVLNINLESISRKVSRYAASVLLVIFINTVFFYPLKSITRTAKYIPCMVTIYPYLVDMSLGTPDNSQAPEYPDLETHIDYTGQMYYERFQNLDLDKAELEVFKLFFFWIPLFFLSIGVRFESAFCLF